MRRYSQLLTEWLKRLIIQKDLIDTGRLLKEAKIYTIKSGKNVFIDMTGPHYLLYLWERYVLEDLLESDILNEVVATLLAESIMDLPVDNPANLPHLQFIEHVYIRVNNEIIHKVDLF